MTNLPCGMFVPNPRPRVQRRRDHLASASKPRTAAVSPSRVRRRLVRDGCRVGRRPIGCLSWWQPGARHVEEAARLRGRDRPVAAFEPGRRGISDRSRLFKCGGLLGHYRGGLLGQGAARAPKRYPYGNACPHLGRVPSTPAAGADGFERRPALQPVSSVSIQRPGMIRI